MHIHLLGICGTFMAGIAIIAQELGFTVTGADENIYPPMSTVLENRGIVITPGYNIDQLSIKPDLYIVGNAMKRGLPIVEALLDQQLPFVSAPQWLYEHVLRDRWVLAVAGTHGKTTTSSLLAWILEQAGLAPGFLIGGVPMNFPQPARLGQSSFFVIEADEYDTAFFDKRSKFIHYRPRTLIINNIEYDHADIFPDLMAIKRQFHHLLRTVPRSALIVHHSADANIADVLSMGCFSQTQSFGQYGDWVARNANSATDFYVDYQDQLLGKVQWSLCGEHNRHNALAAIAAARHVGVLPSSAIEATSAFLGVKRRLEIRAQIAGITVYDDFAHHPTAIAATIEGLRQKVGHERIIAVLECGSYTMRTGVHQDTLVASLKEADAVFYLRPSGCGVDWEALFAQAPYVSHQCSDIDQAVIQVSQYVRAGDHVLVMSNTAFGGFHDRLIVCLAQRVHIVQ